MMAHSSDLVLPNVSLSINILNMDLKTAKCNYSKMKNKLGIKGKTKPGDLLSMANSKAESKPESKPYKKGHLNKKLVKGAM